MVGQQRCASVLPSGDHTGSHPETALSFLSGWCLSDYDVLYLKAGPSPFPHRPSVAAHLSAGPQDLLPVTPECAIQHKF